MYFGLFIEIARVAKTSRFLPPTYSFWFSYFSCLEVIRSNKRMYDETIEI